jgi:hypothetical protein
MNPQREIFFMLISNSMKKLITKIPNDNPRNYGAVAHIREDLVEYCDGFHIIQLKNTGFEIPPGSYSKEQLKRELVVKGAAKPSNIKYPDTSRVIPTDTHKILMVNGKLLADALNVITADSKNKMVRLETNKDGVMKVFCDDNMALLIEVKENKS